MLATAAARATERHGPCGGRLADRLGGGDPDGLGLGQAELERGLELADLLDHPLDVLLDLGRGPALPGRIELEELVLLGPDGLLLRRFVDRALEVIDLALGEALD